MRIFRNAIDDINSQKKKKVVKEKSRIYIFYNKFSKFNRRKKNYKKKFENSWNFNMVFLKFFIMTRI